MFKLLRITSLVGLLIASCIVIATPVAAIAFPITPPVILADVTCKNGEVHPINAKGEKNMDSCCPGGGTPTAQECLFKKYINPAVSLFTAGLGIIILISFISGAIMYGSAGADTNKLSAAKQRMANSLFTLAAFIFAFAFFAWLTPGGISL